jgi:thiosulfate/3-mercaptopyruvate sulfurtransferase
MSSQFTLPSYLVTPTELNAALQKSTHSKLSTAPRIVPLCASWFLPNDSRNGYDTFITSRIPHARFFDLDAIKDATSSYPHMLPSAPNFAEAMSKLGIRREDTIVVYDSKELGIFSAPRVGWTMKVFGHPDVHVLNNFRKWCDEGFPVESGEVGEFERTEYAVPEVDRSKVVAYEEVRNIAMGTGEVQILDARSKGRFDGTEPEPREGKIASRPKTVSIKYMLIVHRSLIRPHASLALHPHLRPAGPDLQNPPPRIPTQRSFPC